MTNRQWLSDAKKLLNMNANISRETKEKFLNFLINDEIIKKARDAFSELDLEFASKHDLELFLKDAIFGCVKAPKYSFNGRIGGKI